MIFLVFVGVFGCSNDENPASSEGSDGAESGGEHEGSEAGVHQEEGSAQLSLDQTYDEVRNGVRLTMAYESQTNAFVGTVENTTTQILSRVRVEVHLTDGTSVITAELGPTTPTDLMPGEQIALDLSAAGEVFVDWSPHVETGSGDGSESGETDPSSPVLALTESWDGVVNGLRVVMSYDSDRRSFSGTVENTTSEMICFAQIELNLKQGTTTIAELGPEPVGDLAPGAQGAAELLVADEPDAAGLAFDGWQIHPEVFDCSGSGPVSSEGTDGGESSEGGEGSEGSEGNEHDEGSERN